MEKIITNWIYMSSNWLWSVGFHELEGRLGKNNDCAKKAMTIKTTTSENNNEKTTHTKKMNYCVIGKSSRALSYLCIAWLTQLEWLLCCVCVFFIFAYYCVLRSFTRSLFASRSFFLFSKLFFIVITIFRTEREHGWLVCRVFFP